MNASSFSNSEWTFALLLPTGRAIRRKIQRLLTPVPVQVASASIFVTRIIKWDGDQDIKQVLTAAFDAPDYLDCIQDLQVRNIDPLSYIDSLDKVSSRLTSVEARFIMIWR